MTAGSSRSTATTIASVLFGVAMLAASAAPAAASATRVPAVAKLCWHTARKPCPHPMRGPQN